jgi:multidrug resistance efflux pump
MNGLSNGPRLVIGAARVDAGTSTGETAANKPSGPAIVAPNDDAQRNAAALALLQLQADLRTAKTPAELAYCIANESRSVLKAQQVIVFERGHRGEFHVHTISSLTSSDRSSPLLQWFESIAKLLARSTGLDNIQELDASTYGNGFEAIQQSYPLRHMLWVPWTTNRGPTTAGMLLARSTPWSEGDVRISAYVAGAFGHAWNALGRNRQLPRLSKRASRAWLTAIIVGGIALMALPVPMTALAPVEIAARETFVVTPGIDGAVRSVDVEPNAPVKVGQLLVTLNDTILRNKAEIAEQEELLAQTKYKKAIQLAFVDPRGRHEMAIAKSELELKSSERVYARELLERTEIRAERDGVAFFADKKDLVGKPVAVGDKLMEIANPDSSEFHVDLPVADAVVIHEGARIKVFLDSDPLNPIEARLVRAAYKAAPREGQQFAFRIVAEAVSQDTVKPRLGMRGTAQIYSNQVSLGFYLFRRPIAAARQWFGI